MKKRWDKDDIQILRARYADNSNKELAKILYRSPLAIAVKANNMGLKKSDFYLSTVGFRKGYTPFNKGRKMEEWLSPEVHEKIKANQARTADRNRAAAKPDGALSRRHNGNYIKVMGRWIKLSHHVWTQHHGPIPEGYTVFYHDRDIFNTDISNLYLGEKNNPPSILARKTPEERTAIARKLWETRRQKEYERECTRGAELDRILAEIRASENNMYYRPNI